MLKKVSLDYGGGNISEFIKYLDSYPNLSGPCTLLNIQIENPTLTKEEVMQYLNDGSIPEHFIKYIKSKCKHRFEDVNEGTH